MNLTHRFVAVATALSSIPLFANEPESLSAPYPEATRGEAAIQALGDRLAEVAELNEMTVDELRHLLVEDRFAWLGKNDRVFFVDEIPAAREEPGRGPATLASSIPTSEAFKLHSKPDADRIIYLDFTGHHSVNNDWGHNIMFPPFNTEGSSSTFTENELQSIIAHWLYMAEDYAPFDVDVTTEEPPVDWLIKSGGGDTKWGVRDVHTQATGGFGNGIGGVAFLNSFNDSKDNPVFSFNKGDNNGSMTGSHEVGHAFGLGHDGLNGSTYHPGTGSGETGWGPIMGAPFGKNLVQFSNGDYSGSTNTQNDYSVITKPTNGVTFEPDDFGDTLGTASPVSADCPDPSSVTWSGVIETRTDKDTFRFESVGGAYTIEATAADPGGNLDILLELYAPNGALIASGNPTNGVDATILASLGSGSHTILIDGTGKSGVYSDYGSLGAYSITLNTPAPSGFNDLGNALPGTTTPNLAGFGFGCPDSVVNLTLSGALSNASVFMTFGVGQLNVPFLGGTLVPDVTNAGGTFVFSTGAFGTLSLNGPLPSSVPSGISVVFQFWAVDPGGPQGYSASNALELVFP